VHAEDHSLSLNLPDEAATLALGGALARALSPGQVIHLEGDLGSGKTTLTRGVLRGLGYAGNVKSPTFTLVELYVISGLNFHHFDFYRFSQPEEYLDAGLDEYFQGEAVCFVEWPDKAGDHLAPADLRITLLFTDSAGENRRAVFFPLTDAGRACLNRLRACLRDFPPASTAANS
jgi:tRNA threonylcarbamoyladenosine biosynthesis protein TsaE